MNTLFWIIVTVIVGVPVFIAAKAIKEKRNNLNLCRPRKTTWKAQDFSSALIGDL